ncbi:hypothetical protein CONCODRAFT_35572, partial [Conidiobolus coronatus NRRL 28638]
MTFLEKTVRDSAIIATAVFLNDVEKIDLNQVTILWAGLFYGFWMADKPIVQQDTAKNIGDVITLIKPDNAYLFIEAFWSVLNSKWHEIDRIRTDKFYLLMREIIHASFQLLDDRKWDIKNVKKMMDIYTRYCLDTSKTHIPAGIPSHVISCFHDELSKIVED